MFKVINRLSSVPNEQVINRMVTNTRSFFQCQPTASRSTLTENYLTFETARNLCKSLVQRAGREEEIPTVWHSKYQFRAEIWFILGGSQIRLFLGVVSYWCH
uniref:uncharacterized protein LOC105351772 isoform X2 n=1 Tax=Fragaria vesca subsp. vesca TaxID=101020 RepID=UPI0005C92D17|nr:PREDICTED: uncharacterized protein LOC105351772 isoform X2 [Fragaria vesca subsp. vesca]